MSENTNNLWDEFDKAIDTDGLQDDMKEAASNQKEFKDVPHDTYEVKVEKLELVKSKAGDPMVSCWMKILEGDFKGQLIFMNQVVNQGFQINIANGFLEGLDSGVDVEFINYKQYGSMLMDIAEEIDGVLEYQVEYGQNSKGFNTFEILDVYEVE
jgi:hypothetical protein